MKPNTSANSLKFYVLAALFLVWVVPAVSQVRVNVEVTDALANNVTGLKVADFKLFENDAEQQITALSEQSGGLDMMIVADNTGSLRTQLKTVTKIGKILVANLASDDTAEIIRFVSRDKISIQQPWTGSSSKLNKQLDNMYIEGGHSAVIDALYLAVTEQKIRSKAVPGRRQAIVLISDCEDRASFYNQKQLLELLRDTPIRVFIVGLTGELPSVNKLDQRDPGMIRIIREFMHRISTDSGGSAYELDKKPSDEHLARQLLPLMSELRANYVVSYVPSTIQAGNNVRNLKVIVVDAPDGSKRTVIAKDVIMLVPPLSEDNKKKKK